ncbi:hypothetical protein [Psychrobacter vallis]|uniref:hypothetical protein n=1 Tax=Psychrobacter vallis TaxID=248451 RepID=UPI0019187A56|nr:hypothetical protein [Psychrobacter vallis]
MTVSVTIDKTKQTLCLKWADMTNPSSSFQEKCSSKIYALILLTTPDYQFIKQQLLTGKKRIKVD